MKEIKLSTGSGNCNILVGESIAKLPDYIKSEKVLVVTDSNVAKLHGDKFSQYEMVVLEPGESNKTLESVQKIYDKCLELELERNSFIVGIGGGVVCDIANFVASTYLRGINCILVPTTLLAQVDASIGGKNGVNLQGYKNLIGTIRQPKLVLCDLTLLKTLPKEELVCGFAEIIKHGAIADENLFSYLEQNCEKALSLDEKTVEKIVEDSIKVKVGIVSRDELESNERMKLNFGHTIGHAIEKVEKINHGQAVAIGMMIAVNLSKKKGSLNEESSKKIQKLIEKIGLPTERKMKIEEIIDAVKKDKKRKNGKIKMILLEQIGKAKIVEVEINELENTIKNLC
ncbi:3-dehydroquinate synthase [Candidatus Micrarchaeota archaeon]|nr:3-dehydroquinate synthase [Candidatus Micrarchaeota archaeon]